jgi:hypothetical protein
VDSAASVRVPRHGRLIAVIEDTMLARKTLECAKLPARAPSLVPAAAGAQGLGLDEDDWFFDQSPARDEIEPLASSSERLASPL